MTRIIYHFSKHVIFNTVVWGTTWQVTRKNSWIGSCSKEPIRWNVSYFLSLNLQREVQAEQDNRSADKTYEGEAFAFNEAQIAFHQLEMQYWIAKKDLAEMKINNHIKEINTVFYLPLPYLYDCSSCSACKTSPSFMSQIFSASVLAPHANVRILLWWKAWLININ